MERTIEGLRERLYKSARMRAENSLKEAFNGAELVKNYAESVFGVLPADVDDAEDESGD